MISSLKYVAQDLYFFAILKRTAIGPHFAQSNSYFSIIASHKVTQTGIFPIKVCFCSSAFSHSDTTFHRVRNPDQPPKDEHLKCSDLTLVEDHVAQRSHVVLGSVLALLLPRTVVLGILPAAIELVDLLLTLAFYLHSVDNQL